MNSNKEKLKRFWEKLQSGTVTVSGAPQQTYEQRVTALIRAKHTVNDEIALLNNYNAYLADNSLVSYKDEYEAYQAYRQECKNIAKGD